MNKRFFELAEKISKLSTHKKHKMGSVLVRKNRLISFGTNLMKTHPKSPSIFKYIHAEFNCIINSKLDNFDDCEIYTFRKTPGGKIANSKPCFYCENLLRSLNFKNIYFSDENGFKRL